MLNSVLYKRLHLATFRETKWSKKRKMMVCSTKSRVVQNVVTSITS